MTPITLNGLRVVSAKMVHPEIGPWVIDCELDPDAVSQAPTSGPASLVIGGVTLTGTVDPMGSGSFSTKASARVLAGGGGWSKTVARQDFQLPGGVPSTQVYNATAALVGETIRDLAPSMLGSHVVRTAGPASNIFAGEEWWVDLSGVTNVGPRPSAVADPSLQILNWEPGDERAELACDVVILPGTPLNDARFNGATPIVREIEQTFGPEGSRAVAWCAPAGRTASLLDDLAWTIRELGSLAYRTLYRYRFVQAASGGLALQAVDETAGAPDLSPIALGTGMPGVTATLAPSTVAYLGFVAGRKTDPVLLSYDSSLLPMKLICDAQLELDVGPTAPSIQIAGGGHPVAFADLILTELGKIATAISSLGGTYVPPVSPTLIGSARASTG
jgi:hypothetical protein